VTRGGSRKLFWEGHIGLESPKASRWKGLGRGLPLPQPTRWFGERRRGAVKYDQPEFWSGRVPTNPTTSAGHGFGWGTCPLCPPSGSATACDCSSKLLLLLACVVERFLSNYQSLDESLAVIMAKINEKSNKTPGKSLMTALTSDSTEYLTTMAVPKCEFHENCSVK